MSSDADRQHWARLQELFEVALDVPVEDRNAHLAATIPDPVLRAEVASLIDSHDEEGGLDSLISALSTLSDHGDDPPPEPAAPTSVGPYEVVRPLGHGGMGSIYLARRVGGEGASVALKLLRSDANTDRIRRRFLAEREILARIDHPNIVHTLDDGFTPDGLPYFVMEHVDGVPIDRYCDDNRLPVRERLRLFVSVCDAAHHAHGLGVVHRDLKPANILVGKDGDVRLLDFGIAKILDGSEFLGLGRRTTVGVRLLTPEYASPEQILGGAITPASDLYQLGLLLYRLLTGRIPTVRERVATRTAGHEAPRHPLRSPSQTLVGEGGGEANGDQGPDAVTVAEATASALRDLPRRSRRALDEVVMRALQEDPGDRFESVAHLADCVRRRLLDVPDAGAGVWGTDRGWLRRVRVLLPWVVAGVVALVLARIIL